MTTKVTCIAPGLGMIMQGNITLDKTYDVVSHPGDDFSFPGAPEGQLSDAHLEISDDNGETILIRTDGECAWADWRLED